MMKKYTIAAALCAAVLAGCSHASPIGLVDVNRIVANWPVYQNDQQQLLVDEQTIAQSKASASTKTREAQALQKKYAGITDQLTRQVRDAADKIASQRNLKLILTKEGVGYGGTDITPDVEKLLNITEKATPSPT